MPQKDFTAEVTSLFSRALGREHAALVVCEQIGVGLTRWIGPDGWAALINRARSESATSTDAEPGLGTLVAVAEILSRLIGRDLALRLLEQACEYPAEAPAGEPLG